MTPTDRKILLVFIAISLALRVACLNLNAAEYTDGILQITAFESGFTYWPPLYTVAAKMLAPAAGDLERAAKLVSILSSTLLLIPLFSLAFRLAGRRAAVYATLFYLANPIAARWGIRVMSDSLFALLFFWSAALLLHVWDWTPEAETIGGEPDRTALPVAAFVAACLMGPLAALTRYHGLLLLLLQWPAARAFLARWRGDRSRSRLAVAATALLPWLLVLAWLGTHGALHQKQIAERAGSSPVEALTVYWNLGESFVLLLPYFFTIPVFVLSAVGLAIFLGRASRGGPEGQSAKRFAGIFVVFLALLVAAQSVFGAFQERYFLPLVPFMAILAGEAAARWEEGARRVMARGALAAILLYSFGWSSAVLVLQREAFGDIKQAARYCSTAIPRGARIFSNEWFRAGMPAIKMTFWAKRPVEGFDGSESLSKGDYLCLHSLYGGLNAYPSLRPSVRFREQLDAVRARYDCTEIAWFEAVTVPLLPDIMENPDTHTNPVAWFYRYAPQRFRTVILRIDGVRSSR
jgi:4-amino-4-deoxy-L-arabinose transferase-like glycosyltransferase